MKELDYNHLEGLVSVNLPEELIMQNGTRIAIPKIKDPRSAGRGRNFDNLRDYDYEIQLNKIDTADLIPEIDHSYINSIAEKVHRDCMEDFKKELSTYLQKNLKFYGHKFESDEEFWEFARFRIARFEFPEQEEVQYRLDFKNEGEPGELIGITHENRFRIEHKDGKIIGTIG